MKAKEFLEYLKKSIRKNPPEGYGALWTGGMEAIILNIAENNGFNVRSKLNGGEIGRVDYSLFKVDMKHPRIDVAIEHENGWSTQHALHDFHKLCTVCSPLRIMFFYRRKEEESKETADFLRKYYDEANHHELTNGETLLIGGWEQADTKYFRWHVHLRTASKKRGWEEINYAP